MRLTFRAWPRCGGGVPWARGAEFGYHDRGPQHRVWGRRWGRTDGPADARAIRNAHLLSGVALSTVLSVVFYFRSDLNTTLAAFAGPIGITITLQVESLVRAHRIHEAVTRQQGMVAQMEATSPSCSTA